MLRHRNRAKGDFSRRALRPAGTRSILACRALRSCWTDGASRVGRSRRVASARSSMGRSRSCRFGEGSPSRHSKSRRHDAVRSALLNPSPPFLSGRPILRKGGANEFKLVYDVLKKNRWRLPSSAEKRERFGQLALSDDRGLSRRATATELTVWSRKDPATVEAAARVRAAGVSPIRGGRGRRFVSLRILRPP